MLPLVDHNTTSSEEKTTKQEESKVVVLENPEEEDIVSAFTIQAASDKGIDYDKLIQKFGCTALTDDLRTKILELTGEQPHRLIRRGIFFCHRDLDVILDRYK